MNVLVPLYKHTHLEIDISTKSDRIEWGHARYQSVYRPDRAFELVVQWVTSSGTIVAELVSIHRDFHLITTTYLVTTLNVLILQVLVTATKFVLSLADDTFFMTCFSL